MSRMVGSSSWYRRSWCWVAIGALFALAIPGRSDSASFTIDGGSNVYGAFPTIAYGLAEGPSNPKDILPTGPNGFGLFGLFDTGSNMVAIDGSGSGAFFSDDALFLGLADPPASARTVDVRIDGFGAVTQNANQTVSIPLAADTAEANVEDIAVGVRNIGVSLIGAPVANQVTALIDYTNTVSLDTGGTGIGVVTAPDITFNPTGLTSEVVVELDRFGTPGTAISDGATLGQRYNMLGLIFSEGSNNIDGTNILYDTGTNVTLIDQVMASALGLGPTGDFEGLVGGVTLQGYIIDSIAMAGTGGVYTVLDAMVFVDNGGFIRQGTSAVIGSNLFMQTNLLFDGVSNTLGIGVSAAVPEPSSLLLLGSGLLGLAARGRRRDAE